MSGDRKALAALSWRDYAALAKPRVLALIVFTAAIGMLLAARDYPAQGFFAAAASLIGIALVAGCAAAFNCLVEAGRDSLMRRTRHRPLPGGRVSPGGAAIFATALGAGGMTLLGAFANPLTMWLCAATFFGYAVVYTLILKTATPQNIVIGGASGALPPVLGWTAIAGNIGFEPLLLFLIIFTWTPPHFWALALTRRDEYAAAGVPMLPVTHGARYTRLSILLYALIMFAATLLPFAARMSGWLYLIAALVLGAHFIRLSVRIWLGRDPNANSRRLFSYSVSYLALIFAALIADYYLVAAG